MGLKVNFSKEEAESTPREVPPSGEYQTKIVEIQEKEVKPGSVNVGKPYWNIRFVVQDGKYAGSPIFSNIMLFEGKDGTLGSLAQFLKALGFDITAGEFELPEPDELIGRDINVRGTKLLAGFDRKAQRELPDRFVPRGYKAPSTVTTKSSSNSLLP
jgi:hypothetical protein